MELLMTTPFSPCFRQKNKFKTRRFLSLSSLPGAFKKLLHWRFTRQIFFAEGFILWASNYILNFDYFFFVLLLCEYISLFVVGIYSPELVEILEIFKKIFPFFCFCFVTKSHVFSEYCSLSKIAFETIYILQTLNTIYSTSEIHHYWLHLQKNCVALTVLLMRIKNKSDSSDFYLFHSSSFFQMVSLIFFFLNNNVLDSVC